MRVLLDTHAFIWASEDPARLGVNAANVLRDPGCERLISVASIWEMAIKLRNGRLTLAGGMSLGDFVKQSATQMRLTILDVSLAHALIPENLSLHHNDPFDRILVAQCICEGIPIVSIDAKLDPYGIRRIW